jgi:hypothetical protein
MTTIARSLALAAAALIISGIPARAADQTVLGRLLLVKDPAPDASPDPVAANELLRHFDMRRKD